MADLSELAAILDEACTQTNDALMAWANGPSNAGPLSTEAHHICVHITANNRVLFGTVAAALRAKEVSDHG